MTSGSKGALREALTWAATALASLTLIFFYHDLTALLDRLTGEPAATHGQNGRKAGLAAAVNGFAREVRVAADARGHFVLEAAINERPVTMMADTGATLVMLSYEDADRLGLSPHSLEFSASARTANGTARVAPLTIPKLRVADITLRDVPAAIAEPGALGVNLLGMSFLGKLKRFQMQGGQLLLVN